MHHRIRTALLALALLAAGSAFAKDATIMGRVSLESGDPAVGAEIIVKDSWAGIFTMRERELFRTKTNEHGEFSVPRIKYRHTIDILILGKQCGWLAANSRILDTDQSAPGIYSVKIDLLNWRCPPP